MIDQTGVHKESFEPLRTNDRRADFLLSIEESGESDRVHAKKYDEDLR